MAINVTHMAIIASGTLTLPADGDIDHDFEFTLPDNTANRRGVLAATRPASPPPSAIAVSIRRSTAAQGS